MSSSIVYPQGEAVSVSVPANERIAVYSKDVAKVFQVVGYPNYPDSKSLLSELTDGQYISSAFSEAATIEIEAGASEVLYQVGTDAVVTELYAARYQGDPIAVDATATIDPEEILSGIITSTTAAAVSATLPTGAVMDLAGQFAVSDSFDWTVINTGGVNAFTIVADTGHTIVGDDAVAASTSAVFRTRKTAADTFVTYRIA